jgi:hypothetical protein
MHSAVFHTLMEYLPQGYGGLTLGTTLLRVRATASLNNHRMVGPFPSLKTYPAKGHLPLGMGAGTPLPAGHQKG